MWIPVISQVATLEEVETHWSLDDLYDCLYVMEMKNKIEKEAIERIQAKS